MINLDWQLGLILVLFVACVLPWIIAEVFAIRKMNQRKRKREAYNRYVQSIKGTNHDA